MSPKCAKCASQPHRSDTSAIPLRQLVSTDEHVQSIGGDGGNGGNGGGDGGAGGGDRVKKMPVVFSIQSMYEETRVYTPGNGCCEILSISAQP